MSNFSGGGAGGGVNVRVPVSEPSAVFSAAPGGASAAAAGLVSSAEEPGGTESGLSLEAGEGEVIPDKVIGSVTFLLQTGLSNPDLRCNHFCEAPDDGEAVPLHLRGAGDGGDPVA